MIYLGLFLVFGSCILSFYLPEKPSKSAWLMVLGLVVAQVSGQLIGRACDYSVECK